MKVCMLQHSELVGPGILSPLLHEQGLQARIVRPFLGEALPGLVDFDWLIVLGGRMGAYDEAEHPWLGPEKALLASAVSSGKKLLGICLGAQMLAEVMGGRVRRADHAEIGWHDVPLNSKARNSRLFRATPPKFKAFQWHQDTFTVPPETERLMFSEACANQAFELEGRIAAVQFHPEITDAMARSWYETYPPRTGHYVKHPGAGDEAADQSAGSQLLRDLVQAFSR